MPFLQLSDGYSDRGAGGHGRPSRSSRPVRGHTVVALYNNQNLWPQFGYPGSSYQDGGYLYRGFQDAGWTMQPDAEASPPPFLG